MRIRTLPVVLILAGVHALAAGAQAQLPATAPSLAMPSARGWIGVEFALQEVLIREIGAERPERLGILVRNVMAGSPAALAGLRPGDRVMGVDGSAATWEVLTRRLDVLRPGERLELRVDRGEGGAPRPIRIQVGERPFLFEGPQGARVVSLDTLRQRLVLNVDSIRSEAIRLLAAARGAGVIVLGGARVVPPTEPVRLRSLTRAHEEGRTMTVIFSGERAVAGAVLAPMNPQLARYFGSDEGLLVLEVLEGTPGHRAGLQGGDVVIEVSGTRVREVEAFRRALEAGYRSPPVPVTVVRDRNEVVLRFRN